MDMDAILQQYLNALKADNRRIEFLTTYEQLHYEEDFSFLDTENCAYALKPKSISDYIVQCYIVSNNGMYSPAEKKSDVYKINKKSEIVIDLIPNCVRWGTTF
jgi:hypothetical protein